ncbi:hypothetical protein TVAG_493540 [Trichomonas vaginalis G3]|uniref:F5/8 type C domain-containing protein n=1 Tax=Trichomonas vaginalis (strain ATCC PRA-98 / G3) TaxID=412133 RepID=A2FFC0_TRIV3|nr:galactose-binding domain-like family [Trichomonas vaginalis G3]EAX96412.1 hypothetical protein TVAG_493540 [Trichomonas vaginalis G3]KAI5514541.1 galactose-binding domain-like family [Trichomonas vaginalis G3]|eukprot:XP_001309342.1 hypothetical protein [Trichomonas vaginalis G3]
MIFSIFVRNSFSNEINGIFSKVYNKKTIVYDVSGSSRQNINGTMQLTKPEYAIYPWNKDYDWCSNCGHSYSEHPYISFSIKDQNFKFNSYFIRAGCCYGRCCCEEDYSRYCVNCCLYSWSLQISDDNKTWKEVHRIEKDRNMRRCNEKTYNLDGTYEAKYVRIIQNEPCPGDPPCLAINRFDLIGDLTEFNQNKENEDFVSYHDDDDDVSIIGHISKNKI